MVEIAELVPLELGLIEEGQFACDLDSELLDIQNKIVQHVKKYGLKAEKAKATLKIEIAFSCLDVESSAYSCVASMKKTVPATPPVASLLLSGETDKGAKCLVCRKTGSGEDNPNQRILFTNKGEKADTETGEVGGA